MNMDLCRYSFSASIRAKTSASIPHDGKATSAASSSLAARKQREFHRFMLSTLYDVPLEQLDENAQLKTLFRYGGVDSKAEMFRPCAASSQVSVDPVDLDLLRC